MRVDMTSLLTGKTDKVSFDYDYIGGEKLFPELSFPIGIHITGEVTNRCGYMFLTLHADAEYDTVCARCLSGLHRSLSLDIEKNVAVSGTLNRDEEDDYVLIKDSMLDADEAAEELLFLEVPSRDLCKDDCRGLCSKCGKNLNVESCDCEKKEIDPRLAVLQKYLDKQ